MEEKIGKRVNVERVDEALALDPDVVSTACPFCLVMLGDAVTTKKQEGTAREDVQVVDVAQAPAVGAPQHHRGARGPGPGRGRARQHSLRRGSRTGQPGAASPFGQRTADLLAHPCAMRDRLTTPGNRSRNSNDLCTRPYCPLGDAL